MGIDQSLTHTGCCILKYDRFNNKYSILDSFSIETVNNGPVEVRINYIVDKIHEKIEKYRPGFICIEDLAFKANSNNGRLLAGLFFTLLNRMFLLKIPYSVVNIKKLKKYATGNGNASKEEMFEGVSDCDILILKEKSRIKSIKKFEDIVDSYFLAKYALDIYLDNK